MLLFAILITFTIGKVKYNSVQKVFPNEIICKSIAKKYQTLETFKKFAQLDKERTIELA